MAYKEKLNVGRDINTFLVQILKGNGGSR